MYRSDAAGAGVSARQVRVAVIGAGFGGIGAAIRMLQNGIDDFVVLERADDVGGTWQVNTYPGAQCDVPSMLYSFSFAPNPEWTRLYPLQPEIHAYLRRCVDQFGLAGHLRLGHEVLGADWVEAEQRWHIRTNHGDWHAQVVIGAMGPFSAPAVPDFPGLDRFRGTVFHSAGWNHDHDLRGERVAVIGTGASAVQFIPHVQAQAGHLSVFQRTPAWILPHPDQPVPALPQRLFRRLPLAQQVIRSAMCWGFESLVPGLVYRPSLLKGFEATARAHLHRQVSDPRLRAKLTPHYAIGCKRMTFSNSYYLALAQPNVNVVTDPIREITRDGVVTSDGTTYRVDTIIFGTGFRITDNPGLDRIRGRAGRSVNEVWQGEPSAYLGTTIAGFPNLFMLLGPGGAVYNSQVVTIEAQLDYVLDALRVMDSKRLTSLDVRAEAQEAFDAEMDRRNANSVWVAGGCSSYYQSPSGRVFAFWPGTTAAFRRRTKRLELADYHLARSPHPRTPVPLLTERSA